MRIMLGCAVALAIVGATLAGAAAHADDAYDGRHVSTATVSFGADDVSFGYRDGYWDNSNRWHNWHSRIEHRDYRFSHPGTYSDWDHDRDNAVVGRVR